MVNRTHDESKVNRNAKGEFASKPRADTQPMDSELGQEEALALSFEAVTDGPGDGYFYGNALLDDRFTTPNHPGVEFAHWHIEDADLEEHGIDFDEEAEDDSDLGPGWQTVYQASARVLLPPVHEMLGKDNAGDVTESERRAVMFYLEERFPEAETGEHGDDCDLLHLEIFEDQAHLEPNSQARTVATLGAAAEHTRQALRGLPEQIREHLRMQRQRSV